MAGFDYQYSLTGSELPLMEVIINDSATLTIGDMVKETTGFAALSLEGGKILGCVAGFKDKKGLPLDHQAADFDGTYTAGGVGVGTYVAAADNTTDKQVKALVRFDPFAVYANTPNATIGTTTGSNKIGYYSDIVAASDQVIENSSNTTPKQLLHLGLNPKDSTQGLYMVAESYLSTHNTQT